MSLRKDIDKLTKLPKAGKVEAKFLPVSGLGRAEQDLQMNNRPVRLRNGNNRSHFENYLETTEYEHVDYNEPNYDEIRRSIRTVLGGELSNEHLVDHIKKRQIEAAAAANNFKRAQRELSQSSSESTDTTSTLSTPSSYASASVSYKTLENEPEEKVTLQNYICPDDLHNKKLYKNGVIRGLLSKNIISMSDLKINNDANNVGEENANSKENAQPDFRPRVDLVEHPNDPDLYTHPLEAYGKLEYTQDFVLDRIGIKKTMTPRQYYMNVTDEDFVFVKKSK